MSQLGFTFYPKDWWFSDTFFELSPIQRYIYLECLFLMYSNGGTMKTNKSHFENRIRMKVDEEDWISVTEKFELEDNEYTHISVNSRLRRQKANKENASKGGAPKGNKNASKTTQTTQKNNPKQPTFINRIEREIESKIEIENKVNDKEQPSLAFSSSQFGKKPIKKLKESCAGYSEWLNTIAKKNSLLIHDVIEWLDAFELHILGSGKMEETEQEFKRYFNSWISSEIRQGRKPKLENQSKDAPQKTHEQIAQEVIIKKYGNRAY